PSESERASSPPRVGSCVSGGFPVVVRTGDSGKRRTRACSTPRSDPCPCSRGCPSTSTRWRRIHPTRTDRAGRDEGHAAQGDLPPRGRESNRRKGRSEYPV